MPAFQTEIKISGDVIKVIVSPDGRLKKTARWKLHEGVIRLRVPSTMPRADIDLIIDRIQSKVSQRRRRTSVQTDADLMRRAEEINVKYFKGELSWRSVRWVNNMEQRLGSCTNGGPNDGDIRISDRIKFWPDYVIDYVIAHEICHRKYPNHSAVYWEYLGRFPLSEKAKGFIEGVFYAQGTDPKNAFD
ncbi:MAG: M48 family metallopeptidase [Anaerolinea sp.]|nr:M48 family metallopeptidase [Anaerolinea sp.]MCC6972455.1 M48 family metallopeptidase [Anaerolineae bacterium]